MNGQLGQSPAPAPAPANVGPNPTRGGTHIIYPWTVRDAQAALQATADGVNQSVQACTGLDAGTASSWGAFYATVSAFTKEDPGWWGLGSRMDRVQSYEDTLYGWQTYLATKCALTLPTVNPNVQEPPSPWAAVATIGGVAIISVAAAYGISRVVELIPKPLPRSAPAPSPRPSPARRIRR